MSHVVMSMVWGIGWLIGVQELPFVDVREVPLAHRLAPQGPKQEGLRSWLISMDRQLNQGQSDGRISKGEFLLARSLPQWRRLRRWETFGAFAGYVARSIKAGRCRQRAKGPGAPCPRWPQLPKIIPTMQSTLQGRVRKRHYPYSRYARRCRELAMPKGRRRRVSSRRYGQVLRQARQRQKRLRALVAFVESLPKYERKEQWLSYLKKQWRRPAFRKRMEKALGFVPTQAQMMAVLRLIRRGKRPGVGDMLRLSRMVLQTPLRSVLAPNMLSGWRIWAGDTRSRRKRMRDWRSFLRGAPTSCKAPLQRMIQRGFLCGTTLRGAYALLSKSPLMNHFVRGLIRPFRATTFDEGLKVCVLSRISAWMSHGYGKRCLSTAQKERLYRLVVRESMFRYEPYGSARARAMGAMLRWRPVRSLPCFLAALHPRREPKSYVRDVALRALGQLLKHPGVSRSQRRLIRVFLAHSADRSFEPAVYARAAHVSMQHGDRRVLSHVLKRLYIRPHGCRLSFWGKRGKKRHLWPTNLLIPSSYWSALAGPLVVGRMARLPRKTRLALYQLVQCGGAPLSYVQQAIRSLQPRYEPDATLRKALWRALLWRYLYLYRSRILPWHPNFRYEHVWKSYNLRTLGLSAEPLLRRLLLVYAEQVGLRARAETSAAVRETVMMVVAALRHPFGLISLQRAHARGLRWPSKVQRALLGWVVLWPYVDHGFISRQQNKDPRLVIRPFRSKHLARLPRSQRRVAAAFYRWWQQRTRSSALRRQIKRNEQLYLQ